MMEQYIYQLECVVCDCISKVVASYDDETPEFCPMCGSEAEVEYLGDSDVM
jgi:rRNA maturation endonuclease Nob1